jgi:signal transduction histidine kinase
MSELREGCAPPEPRPAQSIGEQLSASRAELANELIQALRATMFDHRPEVRPALFGRVAAAEIETLLSFLSSEDDSLADQRGVQLCRSGFGEEGVLGLGQALRRFTMTHISESARVVGLTQVERYHSGIVRGYSRERKALILEQQERIRSAIQRTNSRFALQIEVASDIARATTSILDLGELLQTAVDLIRERFGLYYVGIFLGDEANRWVTLQASAGEPGQVMLRRGYRLKIGGDSLVGWCVAHGKARIALDVGGTALSFDRPLLEDIHSEMVVPLISRHKVIGAMAMQSRQVGAFSEHDVAVYRITSDQLANAIENARLFYERERRIAELRLAKEAAESASRAKSTFLATMSHELRTPLTAILGYTELIQRAAAAQQYAHIGADLNEVLVAGRHLLSLINEVLDFSKIEAEKMFVTSERFAISALLDEVASTVRPLIEQNRNRLSVDCDPQLGFMLSDATRIRQVLVNLLGNAAKFTEAGSVRLSARREADAQGDWIVFAVADTGIGIAADKLHKLFQPFSQIDDRPERLYGGTGLGLALCQRLCQLLGGTISVASTLAIGSTFTVRLPAQLEEQAGEQPDSARPLPAHELPPALAPESPLIQLGDALALIIADDRATIELVERQLSAGDLATIVADGASGLQLSRDLLPEVLLIDSRLAGGIGLLAELRRDPQLALLPVIVFSSEAGAVHGRALQRSDGPDVGEPLLTTVRRALRVGDGAPQLL